MNLAVEIGTDFDNVLQGCNIIFWTLSNSERGSQADDLRVPLIWARGLRLVVKSHQSWKQISQNKLNILNSFFLEKGTYFQNESYFYQ